MSIENENYIEIYCGKEVTQGFPSGSIDCTVKWNEQINVWDGFETGMSADPDTFQFNIPRLTNPKTGRESSSFKVYFYDKTDDYPIYEMTEGLTVTMTSFPSLEGVSFTRGSE